MSNGVTESKELEVKNESVLTIQGFLNVPKIKSYLENVLKERTGQFITSLVSLANLDSKLMQCKPRSLMMCGLKSASLNLPLDNNLGFAYAIPFGNEAVFIMGYKGFIQLAMRTGIYRFLNVLEIHEGELKEWNPLTETLLLDISNGENKTKPIIGYAAMFELTNGFKKVIYRTKEVLLAHGKRFSKTYSKGPWQSDTDAMCKKTLIKELLSKWAPLSTQVLEGIKADHAVIRETDTGEQVYEYIDSGKEQEAPTYDIDGKLLAELNDMFDILKTNPAERSMKLAGCKGNPKAIYELRLELIDEIKKMPSKITPSEEDNSPHADELFGKDKPPQEVTTKEPFTEQDKVEGKKAKK